MNVKKAISKRQSIRKYKDKPVSDKDIKEILEAARLAPSGNNTQPSKFFVVKDKAIKKILKKEKIFLQDFVYQAGAIVICCTDEKMFKKRNEDLDDANKLRAIRDLSIASSFLVLRATELKLGTCFVGWLEKEKIKDILDIPKDYLIPYVITVGHPDEKPEKRGRKTLDEITF